MLVFGSWVFPRVHTSRISAWSFVAIMHLRSKPRRWCSRFYMVYCHFICPEQVTNWPGTETGVEPLFELHNGSLSVRALQALATLLGLPPDGSYSPWG